MTSTFSKVSWLILPAVLFVGGCAEQRAREAAVYVPLDDPSFVVPDYASRAIQATGTQQLWAKTDKIDADCIVTFYQPDGGYYLTEQHHEIRPWLNSIRISAREPQGNFTWHLADGVFSVVEGAERVSSLPIKVYDRDFAEAILGAVTAPVRLLDGRFKFEVVGSPVKIEGRWYNVISRTARDTSRLNIDRRWSVAVFYQGVDGSLVDTLWFADTAKREYLAVRSYDYRQFKKGSVRIPGKIEIFRSNAQGDLQQRLVEIDYY